MIRLVLGLLLLVVAEGRVVVESVSDCTFTNEYIGYACTFGYKYINRNCSATSSDVLYNFQKNIENYMTISEFDDGWFLLRIFPIQKCMKIFYLLEETANTVDLGQTTPPFKAAQILPSKYNNVDISYVVLAPKTADEISVEGNNTTFKAWYVQFKVVSTLGLSKRSLVDFLQGGKTQEADTIGHLKPQENAAFKVTNNIVLIAMVFMILTALKLLISLSGSKMQ